MDAQVTKKIMTLVFLYSGSRVLLAMKKRGFGAGRWNGYGGKLHQGETIEEAARRELQEEAGITAPSLSPAGTLRFIFPAKSEELEVHLFRCDSFAGDAVETEEMRPQWFEKSTIPFNEMWPDDPLWLPQFLAGKTINGAFWFQDENTILRHEVHAV